MKWVLILVVFPTTWHHGTENHVQYPTSQECDAARDAIKMQRDHLAVCVPEDQEFWYYENLRPK